MLCWHTQTKEVTPIPLCRRVRHRGCFVAALTQKQIPRAGKGYGHALACPYWPGP